MSTFSPADVQTVVEILREAARVEIMPRFRGLVPKRAREKSSRQDLVTDADEAAEAAITAALLRAFPGAIVVGEEATERDPSLLDRLADPDLAARLDAYRARQTEAVAEAPLDARPSEAHGG